MGFHGHESLGVKFIETERRMVGAGAGKGDEESVSNGDRVSVWDEGKFWRRWW